ncbi:MAG: helix-turn-helix transcriptional regulator [Clostridia bacterium]|nr:helix-turn-helix transcriptional regulator [Clostridia bacterium]
MLKKQIVEYKDFGCVKFNLDKIMKARNIKPYELSIKANIGYKTIKKLMNTEEMARISTDVIAKLCYIFDCDIADLMEYQKPN